MLLIQPAARYVSRPSGLIGFAAGDADQEVTIPPALLQQVMDRRRDRRSHGQDLPHRH